MVDNGRDPPSSALTKNNPAAITLSAGKHLDLKLQDAATNTAGTALKIEHGSSGVPVASSSPFSSFGVDVILNLDGTTHSKTLGARLRAWWRAVGPLIGNCAGSLSVIGLSGGSEVEFARFNDYAMQVLCAGGETNPGYGTLQDPRHGTGVNANGDMFIGHTSLACITVNGAGGVRKAGFCDNVNAPIGTQSVGVAPVTVTNSVAGTGTPNTFPDFTNGSTYATDYANLHAAVSQMAAAIVDLKTKATAHDAKLKLFGLFKV